MDKPFTRVELAAAYITGTLARYGFDPEAIEAVADRLFRWPASRDELRGIVLLREFRFPEGIEGARAEFFWHVVSTPEALEQLLASSPHVQQRQTLAAWMERLLLASVSTAGATRH